MKWTTLNLMLTVIVLSGLVEAFNVASILVNTKDDLAVLAGILFYIASASLVFYLTFFIWSRK